MARLFLLVTNSVRPAVEPYPKMPKPVRQCVSKVGTDRRAVRLSEAKRKSRGHMASLDIAD